MEPIELYDRIYQWLFQNGLDFTKSLLKFIVILIVGKIAISIICRVAQRVLHQARQPHDSHIHRPPRSARFVQRVPERGNIQGSANQRLGRA